MKQMNIKSMKKSRKIGLLAGVFFAATTLLAGTAYAAASTAIINAGTLAISAPTVANFAGVTLDGTSKSTTAAMGTFTVTDARGSGAGWNVTVQATQMTTGGGTPKLLALGSISMPQPTVAKVAATSGAVPSLTAGPYLIDVASPLKISSAAADGTGMGSYLFTPGNLTLNLPASVYAGTYTSTITVSIVAGP
jgi:hypothetical protein